MIPKKPRGPVELGSRNVRVFRQPLNHSCAVIVAVTSTTPPRSGLVRCLESIASQTLNNVGVVLLLDGIDAQDHLGDITLPEEIANRVWEIGANCGSPSRARNAILDFVDGRLPTVRWVARLDDDDVFATSSSLQAAIACGESLEKTFVLGGNRVVSRSGEVLRENPAVLDLLEPEYLTRRVREMATGTATNELPSCNLVVRTHSGIRYPDVSSAEDHWLVAELLFHRSAEVALLESPLFADYTINGDVSQVARTSAEYQRSRQLLDSAVRIWSEVSRLPGRILGLGQEGIVREHQGLTYKHFYPDALTSTNIAWLETLGDLTVTPIARFDHDGATWTASYPFEETKPFVEPCPEAVKQFLRRCLEQEVVCANIKRSNFRIRPDGSLLYIDVGKWIIPMDVSYFRDSAARLYSIGILGHSDEELQRRPTESNRPEVWHSLKGFSEFYAALVGDWIRDAWAPVVVSLNRERPRNPDVTLLIKACAMDARDLRVQVIHIVDQLCQPTDFAHRLLVIDPFEGPFLRQHAPGDLPSVLRDAELLKAEGWIDDILIGPTDRASVAGINHEWFGVDAEDTHAFDGVPVTTQVWAFDQISTRYVLQADLDVLIGRCDYEHDYLQEMLHACSASDVVGVAFNIPHEPLIRPYDAPPGEFKPEVRLGLLDLDRLRSQRPLPALAENGRLNTTWYRALHRAQKERGLRTLRGGNSTTFYLHPLNPRKSDANKLGRIRDLTSQGLVPSTQLGRWDVEAPDVSWSYRKRAERVVVVALGRNTSPDKVARFATGLALQDNQDFGVVVIDDASDRFAPSRFQRALGWLGERLTLVRNPERFGHVHNYRLAIGEICVDPQTMILIVDADDALAHPSAIGEIAELSSAGHDVVLAAPFRPDQPTCVYSPRFNQIRETYGGDVWIHLRSFRKRHFDELRDSDLRVDDLVVDEQVDYAMMMPIVERAASPVYLPRYRYWHERSTVLDEEGARERDRIILRLLEKLELEVGQ